MTHSTTRRRASVRARMLLAAAVAAGSLAPAQILAPRAAAQDSTAMGSPTVVTEQLNSADRYKVAATISQRLSVAARVPVVYLVSGQAFADGLAAGPAAARDGGAILYTQAAALPAATRDELIRLAPGRVEVIGPATVIGQDVVDQVVAALPPATVVERVAGTDAYGTAAALSARVFPDGARSVYVASAADFSGAIAAGAAAGIASAPLLLTASTALPAVTLDEIERLAPDTVYVVGDPATVSGAVVTAIGVHAPQVVRVSGADRYATAVAVAAQRVPATDIAVVTSGLDYSSGLAAVPLAVSRGAPIVFVGGDDELPVTLRDRFIATHPTRLVLAGPIATITRAELIGFSDGRLTAVPATPYPAKDAGYHDFGEMVTLLRATEIAYPTLFHAFSVGKSYEGRDIWAGKISSDVSVDEGKPEVLVDTLHHADEHLGVEQALYLLNVLTSGYTTDKQIHRLVDERTIWIVFALNPDGWAYDLSGGVYHFWRKNRQPYRGYYGTDLNRNYPYMWGCCGGSSHDPWSWKYRGTAPWSAPETKVLRDFVAGRVIDGRQRIRTHVTLHTNGELILYPWGYTQSATSSDMTADDRAVFVSMGAAMAKMNGYTSKQSSHLYITDGDEIDWLYSQYRIFTFTFELYPTEQGSTSADVYPPYSIVPAQTARNRGALLYLIDMAGCPYWAIGKAAQYCGAGATPLPAPSDAAG